MLGRCIDKDALARYIGAPDAYDDRLERIPAMTDFVDEHGFAKKLYAQVQRFNVASTQRASPAGSLSNYE